FYICVVHLEAIHHDLCIFFFPDDYGKRGAKESRGLGDVYKRHVINNDENLLWQVFFARRKVNGDVT
ncbi:hypothetical protein, partial [Escherichia coli]|uniref:hypothetical protein n=1 Tax=Escherichia coli TaxID=562 RepID=UPI000B69E7E5